MISELLNGRIFRAYNPEKIWVVGSLPKEYSPTVGDSIFKGGRKIN
jgi:hypothetical protein